MVCNYRLKRRQSGLGARQIAAEVLQKEMRIRSEKRTVSSSTSPCAQLRAAYHDCFNRWYSEKYLKGRWEEEECCVVEWNKYRECLSKHLDDKQLSRFLEVERGGIPDSVDGTGS